MKFSVVSFLLLVFSLLQPFNSRAQWESVPGYGIGNILQLEITEQGQLFALFQGGGLFRSENHGLSWQQMRLDNGVTLNVQSFAISPTNILFAVATGGVWRSENGGTSWTLTNALTGDGTLRSIAVAGNNLFVARYGKLLRADLNGGPLTQVYSIEPDSKMYLFADGPELWVAPKQGNIRMTPDQGQNWVHYPPDFFSKDICFQGDTVWGVQPLSSISVVNFVLKGNTSTVYSRPLPLINTYAVMTATAGNVYMVYPNRIYRYQAPTTSWEVFLESSNLQTHDLKITNDFQFVSTGSGLLRRIIGSDTWDLCNTGIPSGSPIGFQHFDRYLLAYNTYSSGLLPPTTSYWFTPHEFSTGSVGKGPGGLYGRDNSDRLWFTPYNLQQWTHIGPAPAGGTSRFFSIGDTLFAIGNGREIFRNPAPGQAWETTGFVPTSASGLYKKLLIMDTVMYNYDDATMKFYRLNPQTGQMVPRGTIPGSFIQTEPPFDALPPAIFIRSNKLYYSPNEGQTWIAWPEKDDSGQSLLFKDFVASEAGFFGLNQFPGQIYFAAEPGDPFVLLPFPPMDTLAQPNTNPVLAIEYVDGYLYAVQNNGRLYRRSVEKQALQTYSGQIWRDDNENGVWDTTEVPLVGAVVQRGGFRFGITDAAGRYILSDDLDPDTLRAHSPWPGWTVHPPFRANTPPSDTLDFRITPPFFRNYCVDMSLYNPLRPGFSTLLKIDWQNLGAADHATLRFVYPGSQVQIQSISPAPDAILGDTLVWELTNIQPAQKGSITLLLKTDQTIPIGTVISLMTEILPILGDEMPNNNRRIIGASVVGSYDPNDKQVEPTVYSTQDLAAGKPLSYTIRFQNTGNYPASFVVVRDTLAANLNLATLQILSASHPYRLRLVGERILEFLFDPIDLPDSISNEPASHGFVRYSIVPVSTLQTGSATYNTAYIYFDFNAPIQTNTVETKISSASFTQSPVEKGSLLITPNPASDQVRIELPEAMKHMQGNLSVYDLSGRVMFNIPASGASVWISVAGFQKGTYIVRWSTPKKEFVGKLVRP